MKLFHLAIAVTIVFLLVFPLFTMQGKSNTQTQTLYNHMETTTIGGVTYYLHKTSSADGPATSLSVSAATTGRKLTGRWVYPLTGIASVPASTWTVTYRAKTSGSATSVVAHGDVDILIRKSDNTIRTTIATNVANSPSLTQVNIWETLTGTYSWTAYTVVDQTDYLEVAYYIHVTTSQSSKSVYLRVDDNLQALADQTKVENIMFTYPNQAPAASFTYSPTGPVIYETVTFNASASYDPDGSIVSYQWNFGDGNITTVTNPIITHAYTTATSTVNYTVTLTVTDSESSTGFATRIVPVTNPAILHVSLPAGTYNGVDPDPWLNDGWLLNINASSGTFTLRINDTSSSITSYDTHLIIALNNASHDNLVSLYVNGTPISTFQSGTPKPYNIWNWPSGDVYPTWFADTYIVGTINPKGYTDLIISVTFSNATGTRIHFDAYGSKDPVPPTPDVTGKITHNPLSEDSTVSFFPPAVVQYYLTVKTDPAGVVTIPGEGWYPASTNVTLTAPTPVSNVTGTRYRFSHWDVDGSNVTGNPITVHMDANHTATAHYIKQYNLTLVTNPPSVTTPSGSGWYDDGTNAPISTAPYVDIIPGSSRYQFVNWTTTDMTEITNPLASSTTVFMDKAKTVTANYVAQYRLTMATNFGTTNPSVGQHWYDAGSVVPISATPPSAIDGERYVWLGWTGTGTISYTGMDNPASVTMNSPINETAAWRHEYRLRMATNYGTTTPSVGDHWYEAGSVVAISATPPSAVAGERYAWNGWVGTGNGSYSTLNNPASVTMNGPISETASWTHQFLLTIKTNGLPSAYPTKVYLGGSQVGTASDALSFTKWFDAGASTGTIGVDGIVPGATGTRYIFVKWVEDSSTSNPRPAETMSSPKTFTAQYKTQYYLTVNTNPGGLNPAPTPPSNWYDNSTNVALTAPNESYLGTVKYSFTEWNVDGSKVTGNPIVVHMNNPHTATAHYATPQPRPVGGFWEPVNVGGPSTDYTLFILVLGAIAARLIGTIVHLKTRSKRRQLLKD